MMGKVQQCKFYWVLLLMFANILHAEAQCRGNLIFEDNFDGSSLDLSKWTIDIGNGCPNLCGWGNNEQQYYTNSTNNVNVTGGHLYLTARHSPNHLGSGSNFTSGKIHTRGKFDRLYGRFEARMRMPRGRGLWPAFWMLPTDNVYGGWPTSGEIDIMEYRGDRTNIVDGTLHYGAGWPNNLWDGNHYTLPTGNFADEFHVFAVEWEPGVIRWYVNNVLFKTETQNPNSLNPASNHSVNWPWDQRFHMILNLALGGWFTGNPSTAEILESTTWPQSLVVDYVRVYDMQPTDAQTPYGGTVRTIPGTIQAEHYNEGCNESAYFDTTPGNAGGQFRNDDVDIEETTDVGGGYNVGWTDAGEWLNYSVNVANTGNYNIELRVAAEDPGKNMRIEMDGVNISGTINVPQTGGWQTWQTVTVNNVSLTAGNKIMRVRFNTDGINLNYIRFVAVNTDPAITFNNVTRTYGAAPFNMTATSNSPGAITYSITSGGQFATITPGGQVTITGAGTVTVQASQAAASGYNARTVTATLTINRAALTATADNKTRNYNTANPPLTITYSGFVYGETASVLTSAPSISTTATVSSNVGTYPITLTGGAAANYTITRVNGTLTVTAVNPTLTFNNLTRTYGAASFNTTATSNSSGAITYSITSGEQFASISSDGHVTIMGAGTVTLQASQVAWGNYSARTVTATLTINRATLTATADNKTRPFNTANPALTITYSGFVYGETASVLTSAPSISTTATVSSNVGTYPITLTGGAAANYNITRVNGILTVTAASPTITFNNLTRTYGAAPFNMTATSNSSGAITYSIASGSSFATITSGGQVTLNGAGTVTVQASQAASGNYSGGTATATLTINRATLTATADNQSRPFNTANPALTITYSGFVYGETASVLTSAPSISTTATASSNVGTYPITLTGGAADNYNINNVNGTLTITAISPELTYTGETIGIVGNSIALSATTNSTGAISYAVSAGTGAASISGNDLFLEQIGNVTLTISVAASGNYEAASITRTININSSSDAGLVFTGSLTGNVGDELPLTVGANTTGTVTYTIIGGTGSAVVDGDVLILTGAGTVEIEITITSDDNSISQTITETITIHPAVSNLTEKFVSDKVDVYPVPASEFVEIKISSANVSRADLIIYDMKGSMGLEVKSAKFDNGIYELYITDLPSGVYTLVIQSNHGTVVKKVVK